MTTTATTTTDESASPPPRTGAGRRPLLWVAAVVLLVGAGVAAFFLFHLEWRTWCHGADRAEYQKKLLAETDPALIPVMEDVMRDAKQPDDVRVALAGLLLQKSRPGPVEAALKDPRLDVRTVALEALARTDYFRKQYVQNESYRVRETLLEWLSSENASGREAALAILPRVYDAKDKVPDEVLTVIRAMVAMPPKGPQQPIVRASAAMMLAGREDCTIAPALLALAANETDAFARMREMQALMQLYDAPSGACKPALPEADVLAVVDKGLSQPGDGDMNRAVRMAALQILERHPTWAMPRTDRLRGILESKAHEVERRIALEALASARDPKTVGELPRWFFDASASVRSSASGSARPQRSGLSPLAYEALLVGFITNETSKSIEGAFRIAVSELRQRAGSWIGLPERLLHKPGDLQQVNEPLDRLYRDGTFEGISREAFGDSWYRWLLSRAKLTGPEADEAFKAHSSFWAKAKAGDVPGAKAVYEARSAANPDLWAYERGWILAHS